MHPLLRHFAYDALAPHLAQSGRLFCELATLIDSAEMTDDGEKTAALVLLRASRERFMSHLIQIPKADAEQLPYPAEKDNG